MAYIEHTDIETFLNITLTEAGQETVDALIPAVEAFAESYCNRSWSIEGEQVETFDGGSTLFLVSQPPIATVESVVDDGQALDEDDYYVYSTYVRTASLTTTKPRCVAITYTSAVTIPEDLKHALIRWVAETFKASEDAGKTVRRTKFGSVEVDYLTQDGIPAYVEMVLKRYRLHAV